MDARFRPLNWQGDPTPPRSRKSQWTFRASYRETLALLEFELDKLDARDVVIEADFRETDIRVDGWPRANARSGNHPGVRLAFDSRHGPLVYATDAFETWHANLRALALGLQALRAVDRYGITRRGEQYTGWRQIEAPTAPVTVTDALAAAWYAVVEVAGAQDDVDPVLELVTDAEVDLTITRARRRAHPDTGGSVEQWLALESHVAVLIAGR